MAFYDTQYYPVASSKQTAVDNACSTRTIIDLANSMNNYKARFGPVLVSDAWPNEMLDSPGDANENVVLRFSTRYVADGYNQLSWAVSGAQGTGGTGETTWRLYSGERIYDGPLVLTDGAKTALGTYSVSNVTIDTTVQNIYAQISHVLKVGPKNLVSLILTCENTNASVTSYVNALNVTAYIKE